MTVEPKLKIGLDYHGVIDQAPQYFTRLAQEAARRGHQVFVITGGPKADVAHILQGLNFPYAEIFAILDYYEARGEVVYLPGGRFHIPDDLWNRAKAEYCRQKQIDIHIDDSCNYIRWFSTPYCHYCQADHSCQTAAGGKVNFALPPSRALNQIEQFVTA